MGGLVGWWVGGLVGWWFDTVEFSLFCFNDL